MQKFLWQNYSFFFSEVSNAIVQTKVARLQNLQLSHLICYKNSTVSRGLASFFSVHFNLYKELYRITHGFGFPDATNLSVYLEFCSPRCSFQISVFWSSFTSLFVVWYNKMGGALNFSVMSHQYMYTCKIYTCF